MLDIRKQFVLSDKIQNMIYEIKEKGNNEESESSIIRRAIIELYKREVCKSNTIVN